MINKLYGIDYNTYMCGGIGDKKLAHMGDETVLFDNEPEMLEILAKLKKDYTVGEIKVFTTKINRESYNVNEMDV